MKLRDKVAEDFFNGMQAMHRHVSAHDMVVHFRFPIGLTRSDGFVIVANAASEGHEALNPSLHRTLCAIKSGE